MLQVPVDAFVFSLGTNLVTVKAQPYFQRSAIVGRAFCFVPNSSHVSQKQSAGCEVTIVWGTLGFFYEGFLNMWEGGVSQLNINSLGSLSTTLTSSSFSKVPFYVTTDRPIFKDFVG